MTIYQRKINGVLIDIYDIIDAYDVSNPAAQHAIKKILRGGSGNKTRLQDYMEALASMERAIEIEKNNDASRRHVVDCVQ